MNPEKMTRRDFLKTVIGIGVMALTGCEVAVQASSHEAPDTTNVEGQDFKVGSNYQVQEGDTLEKVADCFNSSPGEILKYNDIGAIIPGQEIVIPPPLGGEITGYLIPQCK